jgi:signal transduction histidine kinase
MGVTNEMTSPADPLAFLAGGGEMGERIRTFNWSKTPVGAAADWPQSLKTAVRIILNSRYPMFVWWGRELINIYNDAYIPMLGARHAEALGQSAPDIWADVWPVVGPQTELVLNEGRATWNESVLLIMERYGYREETYFTFSYSPVPNDAGGVGGIFCAVIEDTRRVIGERQLALLRDLAAKTADARTWQEACAQSAEAMSANPRDLPFAMIYIVEPDGSGLSLAAASGIERGHPAAPEVVGLAEQTPWPFAAVLDGRDIVAVENLRAVGRAPLPTGAWPEPPTRAALLPLAATGQTGRSGVLVVGLNPLRMFDDGYRNFLTLVGGQIAASMASAQAYEEEKKRAESLAELDRAKTAFFSNISHEFRTPLTLMLGPVEDLLAQPDTDVTPATKGQLEIMQRNSLRLLKLVNTMLDFSRIEAGRIQAHYEPVDLATYTAELAGVFRAAIERAGLRLIVTCTPLPEPVYMDRDMWEKIVLNLLSNAFKFTLEGEIEIRLDATGGQACLTVRDTGVGIPAEEMPRIFERFHRAKETRGRTYEGTGRGLALVQELVKLHGGTVRAESVLHEGSRFTVTVPLGTAHLDPQRIGTPSDPAPSKMGAEAFVQEALRWLPDAERDDEPVWTQDDPAPTSGPLAHRSGDAHLQGPRPRILWADDNADMREYVRRLLGKRFEVEAVADGQAALEATRATLPDLVLADIMMPRLDGMGLLRALRSDAGLRDLPVILLSARAGEEARIEGMEAGADDYLVKPFSARELLARVESHVRLARLRREANKALRDSEKQLAAILEQLPVSVGVVDTDGRVTLANALWRAYIPQQLPSRDPERLPRWRAFSHDGTPIPPSDWPGARVLRGRSVSGMDFLHTRDDGHESWLRVSAAPFRDASDTLIGAICVMEDITARKQADLALQRAHDELEERVQKRTAELAEALETLRREMAERQRMQETLFQQEKLAALGTLLANVAHELNNPLAVAAMQLDTLQEEGGADAWTDDLEMLRQAVERCKGVVQSFLALARQQAPERHAVALNALIDDVLVLLGHAMEVDGITIERHLANNLPPVWADAHQLHHVIANLLTNAQHALRQTDSPRCLRLTTTATADRRQVTLEVQDSGPGMSEDVQRRIFDPFFTTKAQGEGSGLGLPLCRSIVEAHGGLIHLVSQPGDGTTVAVTLPAATPEVQVPEAAPEPGEPAQTTSTSILLIDDELGVQRALRRLLQRRGHEVTTAATGQEGLAALEAHSYGVILCDMRMPDLDGPGFYRELEQRHPHLLSRVIFLTGDVLNPEAQAFFAQVDRPRLEKPFKAQEVRQVIQQVIEAW